MEKVEFTEKKYRPLKKDLNKVYKSIFEAYENNEMPSRRLMEDFMAYTEIMVSYQGFGDDNYDEFTTNCKDLQDWYKKANLEMFGETLFKIDKLKKECHSRR